MLVRIFIQRDENSHTFKKKEMGDNGDGSSHNHAGLGLGAVEASPTSQCPPSPSTDGEDFSFTGDGVVLSQEFGEANNNNIQNAYLPQNEEITISHWVRPV